MSFPKKSHHEEAEENWLMSYADMITLLLCFFVILLSVSEPKTSEMEKIRAQFKSSFVKEIVETPFITLKQKLEAMIEQQQAESDISVEETDRGLVLELSSGSFFEPGSADFRPEATPVLNELTEILNQFDYEDYLVIVEGHTDDVPIKNARFPSNWELSSGRASSVVRFFLDHGQEKEKMRVSGLADVQPKVPNLDEFGNPVPENRELNRRIAIRVERQH